MMEPKVIDFSTIDEILSDLQTTIDIIFDRLDVIDSQINKLQQHKERNKS